MNEQKNAVQLLEQLNCKMDQLIELIKNDQKRQSATVGEIKKATIEGIRNAIHNQQRKS
jgi:hypothetical protein